MRYWLILLLLVSRQVLAVSALPVKQIAPGIYVHFGVHELPNKNNHGAIANIGFVIGKRCVAVIDTGGNPQQGLALKKAITRITPLPVCYVINTHVHPDHIYGNKAFKQSGVKFVGHHKLARAMAMRSTFYLARAADQIAVTLTKEDLIPPDLPINNKLQFDLGGRVIELTAHSTAHTDNDVSIYDRQTDTLWLSDLLFIDHIPVLDGSLKGWIKELEQLRKRKVQRVIPGHGPVVTEWPAGMQAEMDYLQLLLRDIRLAIKQGVFMEDAMNSVGYSAKRQWQLFDQFHKKNIATAYAELEWED